MAAPNATEFEFAVDVSWGHCDPAGIIYYPNYFRWFDAAYHAFLKHRGFDQRILAEKLGTMGTGLIDAGATFKAPITYGDRLMITLQVAEWRNRTLRLNYSGHVKDTLVVEGYEVRGMFMADPATGKISAAAIEPLRHLLEGSTP